MNERSHLTVAEVAAALGLPVRTVYYRLEHGYMAGERVSPKLWLVPRSEVERWKGRVKLPRGRYPMRPGDRSPA
jgi:excisionase family DNA binding protein